MHHPVANYLWCTCAKNYEKMNESRQSYSNESRVQFFGPPCRVSFNVFIDCRSPMETVHAGARLSLQLRMHCASAALSITLSITPCFCCDSRTGVTRPHTKTERIRRCSST